MDFFDHVHISCVNLQGMVDFWQGAFGAKFVKFRKFGAANGAVVTLGDVQIFLKEIPENSPMPDSSAKGLNHLGIRVNNPNETAKKLVEQFGCKLTNKVTDDCSFIAHPEGLVLELMRIGADV